jgi:hypothetical protein
MTPEAWIALVAVAVGVLSALVATIFALLTLRVRDIEEQQQDLGTRMITRDLFDMHKAHVDTRLDKQDAALAQNTNATNRALGILERWERKSTPPPRSYGR